MENDLVSAPKQNDLTLENVTELVKNELAKLILTQAIDMLK